MVPGSQSKVGIILIWYRDFSTYKQINFQRAIISPFNNMCKFLNTKATASIIYWWLTELPYFVPQSLLPHNRYVMHIYQSPYAEEPWAEEPVCMCRVTTQMPSWIQIWRKFLLWICIKRPLWDIMEYILNNFLNRITIVTFLIS